MNTEMLELIDAGLTRFGTRDLVSGTEVMDFLLDLRLSILNLPDPLAQLLKEESQPLVG